MEINDFQIKAYGFAELALLYNPECTKDSATKRLRTWIRRNESLHAELQTLGWNKGAHLFTPLQIEAIVRYLGEP